MTDIDRATVRALINGDDRAYTAVVDALHAPVYRFILRLCRDAAMAEDITQETFLAVWQGIGGFAGRSRFTTWVFGIAYRQYLRACEKQTVETVPLDEQEADSTDPCELMQSVEERERVRAAVASLPDLYRPVVLLVHLQGLTYREAAEVLDIPLGTVKSRMNAAFAILRDALTGEEVSDHAMSEPARLS